MNQAEQYIRRVQWHKDNCEWFPAWIYNDKGICVNDGKRPKLFTRICFELEEGLVFFGMANANGWIDCWETKPGEFSDSYAWESVAKWCYESEEHPGIPVVRTYPM